MINLPFDPDKPITGKASVLIKKSMTDVFSFIGERFFENYPKWATDVVEFEPLDGPQVFIGAKAHQIRKNQGQEVDSTFLISDYTPKSLLSCKDVNADYRDYYQLDDDGSGTGTTLTYTFELMHLDLFMRPFSKLIRVAIEDGAEATVENIKNLLAASSQRQASSNQ